MLSGGGTGVTSTVSAATITLFTSLVSAGLYDKIIVMYPHLGGVQNSNKLEAKNPGLNNISFNNTWTFNSSGSTPQFTSGWATNNMYLNTAMTINNTLLYVYLGSTSFVSTYPLDFGSLDSLGVNMYGALIGGEFAAESTTYTYSYGGATNMSFTIAEIPTAIGSFIQNRTNSTTYNVWKNGVKLRENTSLQSSSLPSTHPLYMPGPGGGVIDYIDWSSRRQQFNILSQGLSDSEITSLDSIINTYQTSLGRNVY